MNSIVQKRVWVSGRVQGVGYRAFTLQEATRFPSLKGWVRNLPDGRVEAVFQGDEHDVTEMIQWCWKGSPAAVVRNVEIVNESPDPTLGRFGIRQHV